MSAMQRPFRAAEHYFKFQAPEFLFIIYIHWNIYSLGVSYGPSLSFNSVNKSSKFLKLLTTLIN